jgi:predicted amidohydrolase YtcJ
MKIRLLFCSLLGTAALTRPTSEGQPEAGFAPERRLSVDKAIAAYTLGAAYAGAAGKPRGLNRSGQADRFDGPFAECVGSR